MRKPVVPYLAVLLILLVNSIHAQTTNIVYWNFSSGGASPTSGLFTGLVTPIVTQGNNLGSIALLNTSSSSSSYTTAAGFAASGSTNAEIVAVTSAFNTATSTYLAFNISLSAAAGANYGISDISFGSRSTGTGPQSLSLYESTDGFAASFISLGTLTANTNSTWAAEDFSLSTSALVPDDGSTTSFRIYASGGVGNATAGSANWRIDDLAVTMNSITSTPEPSSIALAVFGCLSCFFRLRRQS